MRNISIGKLLLALSVSCLYIFLFGIVQVVEVSADNTYEIDIDIDEEETVIQITTSKTTEKEPAAVVLSDFKKPDIADYKAQTTVAITTTTETTTEDRVIRNPKPTEKPTEDGLEPAPVETSKNDNNDTPQAQRPAQTTTTTAVSTTAETTTAPQTSESAPAEEPDEDNNDSENGDVPSGEQLSVYDTVTGSYYTASAREIVARAVVGEIWNQFPDEAVKAQAVASYTYIKKSNEQGISPEAALKTDVYDRIYELVDEVLGQAIYYNGEKIQSVFFASSCGYTNSSLNVWGVDYPYLRSVDCSFDESTDPNWGSTATFTSDEVKTRVQNSLGIALAGDPSKWFVIKSRLDEKKHGWITSISVGGFTNANGNKIDGRVMREKVFGFALKSAAFDVSYDKASDSFTFTTYGHGHGVGMSQYGAKALAEKGYDYKQILQHYFTGVEIY